MPSPRKWGVSRPSGRVVDHDGKVYLTIRSTARAREFFKSFVKFKDAEGNPIPYEKISPFIPEKKESKKQAEAGLEGRENQVWQNDFTVTNIKAVKMRGEIYTVVPDRR